MSNNFDRTDANDVSLLLFLEDAAVNKGGRVKSVCMNSLDFDRAMQWNRSGLILFGRIASQDVSKDGSHWVELTDESWKLAGELRMERGMRLAKRRTFQTTEEKRRA